MWNGPDFCFGMQKKQLILYRLGRTTNMPNPRIFRVKPLKFLNCYDKIAISELQLKFYSFIQDTKSIFVNHPIFKVHFHFYHFQSKFSYEIILTSSFWDHYDLWAIKNALKMNQWFWRKKIGFWLLNENLNPKTYTIPNDQKFTWNVNFNVIKNLVMIMNFEKFALIPIFWIE